MIIYAWRWIWVEEREDAYYVCVRDSDMLAVDQGENAQCFGGVLVIVYCCQDDAAIAVYIEKREETHKDIILLERKEKDKSLGG